MELRNKKLTHDELTLTEQRQPLLKTWETARMLKTLKMALNTNKPSLSINASLLRC